MLKCIVSLLIFCISSTNAMQQGYDESLSTYPLEEKRAQCAQEGWINCAITHKDPKELRDALMDYKPTQEQIRMYKRQVYRHPDFDCTALHVVQVALGGIAASGIMLVREGIERLRISQGQQGQGIAFLGMGITLTTALGLSALQFITCCEYSTRRQSELIEILHDNLPPHTQQSALGKEE